MTDEENPAVLRKALKQSLELQAHYAKLLNMHDGGQRLIFESVDAWLKRLRQLGVFNGIRS